MLDYYYENIFPVLMNRNIGRKEILELRRKVLSYARGEVLEIGIGTGINLQLYSDSINHITAIDTFVRVLPESRISVDFYKMSVDNMSFEGETFDTVVSTFCFCSIQNLNKSLSEIKRVLKPDGKVIFLEHGKAKNNILSIMQNMVNPLFNLFAGGCNVNRDYLSLMEEKGFVFDNCSIMRSKIIPKSLVGHLYIGIAGKGDSYEEKSKSDI